MSLLLLLRAPSGTATTATASLTLDASGAATAPTTAAASLTLGASGSVSPVATASGSLSLSASGSWTLTPTTAALSLSASGAVKATASASASISLSASVITTSAYSTTILADSPLGYWRMGESSGTTLTDTSGNTHNGSYVGTAGSTYTLAQTGATIEGDTAVKFSGTPNTGPAGYANVPYAAWMDATSAISVEAWVKWLGAPAASGTGGAGLAFRWQNNSGSVTVGGLWLDTADHIVAQFVVAGSTKSVSTGVEPTVGHWTHCVAVYDGAHVILYIDGVSVGTPAVATGSLTTGNCDLQIGAYKDGQWCLPNHVVDEVAYYNTALSPTRVAAHYSAATTVVTAVAGVASGSASLSLSGSGSANAATTAAASLSLSASGAVTPPAITAAGSLTLSATGSWTLTPSTGSLTLGASGTAAFPGLSASASLALSASGTARAPMAASATLTLSGSGTAAAGSVPGASFSDDFNRANGGLGSNWQSNSTPLTISTNRVVGASSAAAARWATDTNTDDQFSQATYQGNGNSGVAVAMPSMASSPALSATGAFYIFMQRSAVGGVQIASKTASSTTINTLATSATNLTTGDGYRLDYVNGVLTGSINGVTELTYTPGTPITGQRGVGLYAAAQVNVAVFDDWTGGDFVGVGSTASLTLSASGTTRAAGAGAAALSLGASGTATTGSNAASGTASLTLGGSGAARGSLVAGTAFSDDFNRPDGALGTNWAVSGVGPFTIASNQIVGGTTTSMARWTTATVSDNQVSQITYVGGSFSGAAVAIAAVAGGGSVANSGTWYALRQGTVTTGNLQLVQKDTGLTTFTTLASTGSALVSGDVIKLTYVGGVLTGYVNGTQVLTNTPASPITGQRGVGFAHNSSAQSGTPVLDNWSGGDYVGESVASLTLSASGVTGSLPATGTAALTLGATGTATASTTSTAALTLSASGATVSPAAGSGSLTLSAAGFITTFGTAAGTAALTLAAAGASRAALIPGLTFSDDFNVPDGSLSSNWQTTTTPPTITNNQVVGGSATGAARWIVDTATDNQFAQATYVGGTSVGVAVAMPSLAGSPAQAGVLPFYTFRQLTAGGGVAISVKNAPSNVGYTALVSSATNLVAGDVIRLEYVSGTLTAKINGTTILTTTPSTPITGQRGVGFNAIGQTGVALLDNWSGGDNVSSSQASLALSATGSVVPSIATSGTASFTLSASGAGRAVLMAGTASLTLTALGASPVPMAGTASLTLSAAGTGRAALIAGVSYADDFNRPDGALGANWAQTGPAASAPVIVGQQVVGGTAGAAERWIDPTNTDNQFVEATYVGGGGFISVALAMPGYTSATGLAASGTWYLYRQSAAGTGNIGIFQKDLGATTFTNLTNTALSLVAGDVIRLEYVNGTLNGFVNGVLHGFFTPTTPITGQRYVGFEHSSNQSGTPLIDNWSAGDYVQPSAANLTLSASGAVLPATAVSATASLTLGASGTAQARLTAGTTFSDNFNRANGALGSNWEVTTGAATISANHVVAAASANSERWITDTTNDDQFSQATYLGGVSVGVAVAMSPQPGTPVYAGVDPFYVFRQESASAGVIIGVKLAGTGIITTLASSPQNLVAGDVFKLEYFGGVLTGRINGAVVATYTPPTPITGQRGVGFMHSLANQGGTPLIDDWSGGDYVLLSTAVLTLGASGTTRVSTTASASLALTASGTAAGTASGTGSLSLAAAGVTSIPAAGSASLTLGATALAFGSTAAGTASLTLDATVIAITAHEYPGALPGRYRPGITRPGSSFVFPVTAIPAAAAGSASLSLSASGAALLATAGTGSLTLSAHGTAGAAPSAVASLTLSASGVTPTVTMSAAATLVLAASGATQVPVTSAATLTLAATGAAQPQLTAAASLTLAATGATAARPTATASLVLAASGVAPTARLTGTAALTLLASGSSTSPVSGNASLTLAAAGTAPPIPVTASAALALAAAGALQTSVSAAAVLTLGATGTAIGIMPITGTASLSLSASGFALFGSPGFLAQMTLSATAGAFKATAAATAALSLTAQSTTQSLAGGSAALTLTASGTARAALTASAAMSLSAVGAVKAAMSAAAAMVLTATGGPASAAARAAASLTLAGQGSGATRASGTGFIVLSGGASAATRVSGLGHLDLTSQAVTSSRVSGTASLSTFAAATARASLSGLASITLSGSAIIVADTTLYTIWNGTGYDYARLLGLWNGTSYDQVTVLGEWNGTGYNQLTPVP